MDPQLRFGISVVLGFTVWGLVTARYSWPALRTMPGRAAFRPILLLHAFRFVGLAFLVPGVVAPDLPAAFARPAAYVDFDRVPPGTCSARCPQYKDGPSVSLGLQSLG